MFIKSVFNHVNKAFGPTGFAFDKTIELVMPIVKNNEKWARVQFRKFYRRTVMIDANFETKTFNSTNWYPYTNY